MKRALFIVLVIFSLISMVSCGQNRTEQESISGVWEAESELSVLGVALPDADEKQTVDMKYRFEFNDDLTGESHIIVDEKYTEFVPDTNSSFTYVYDGEKLELTHENGTKQVFSVSFSGEKLILDGRAHIELVRIK